MKLILFDMMDTLVREPYPLVVRDLLANLASQENSHKNSDKNSHESLYENFFEKFLKVKNRSAAHAFERGEISQREYFRDFYLEDISEAMYLVLPRPEKVKKMLFRQLTYLPGMQNLLENLQRRPNLLTGIASNYSEWYKIILQKLPKLQNCDYLFFSCELGYRKPQAEYYQSINQALLQETTKIQSPQDILFIDDRKVNINGAKKANWNTFLMQGANANAYEVSQAVENFIVQE